MQENTKKVNRELYN